MSIFVGSRHRAAESGIMSVLSSHKPHAAGVLPVMQAPLGEIQARGTGAAAAGQRAPHFFLGEFVGERILFPAG